MSAYGRFCLLVVFTALSKLVSAWHGSFYEDDNEGNMRIKFRRATATSVVVEVICDHLCAENVTWQVKPNGDHVWRLHSNVEREQNTYQLNGLAPARLYYIQARTTSDVAMTVAETCPQYPLGVVDLRSEASGPGWLDIRWTPPRRYRCRAESEYLVRYRVGNGNFTAYESYGYYLVGTAGHLHFGPSHPCSMWPKEFCLMLTRDVVAGKNHTVELVVKRLNGSDSERSRSQTIEVYADPNNVLGVQDNGIHSECVVWTYVLSGACFLSAFVIVTLLASSIVHAIKKADAAEREEDIPIEPLDSEQNRE